MKAFDKDLELYWHPIANKWILYRVKRRGVASDDEMIQECVVKTSHGGYAPPGDWLLDLLKKWDKTRGGSISPERANRNYLKNTNSDAAEREAQREKQMDQISQAVADDTRPIAAARHSVTTGRKIFRNKSQEK